jgi:ribonuclease HII
MNNQYETAIIVNDDDNENVETNVETNVEKTTQYKIEIEIENKPKKQSKKTAAILKCCHNTESNIFEIGVDEAGRGPLFGRVYTAAVILPKDNTFDHSKMKDSKKFHSKKKIEEVAEYIKANAVAWHVSFEDEKKIDEINILQATQLSMHNSILEVRKQFNKVMKERKNEEHKDYSYFLLIDGNYFNPITYLNKTTNKLEQLKHMCVEGGDNTYSAIAAASILAKVERDKYIDELCLQNPTLAEYYGIDTNKGYGAKKHMDGIKEHGITIWHRRSFGICKQFV